MKSIFLYIHAPLAFLFVIGCSTNPQSSSSRSLRFKDPVTVSTADGRETDHKAEESIAVPSDPIQIESPGKVSILVVPLDGGSGVTDIKMRRIEKWSGTELGREINQRLNIVTAKIIEIQRALAKRSGRDALRMIEELESAYPELTYLNFLKASSYVLTGDRDKARTAVVAGLASFPEDAAGKALLRSLGAN